MNRPDTEKFRLRRFVEKLVQEGECIVHERPIDLIDVAGVLDGNAKAVWFRAVGPERTELVGNVMGARRRLASALDTDEAGFPAALRQRLQRPVAPIEVPSAQAPVHEIVQTGADADLTKLPVHLQHALDGAPYISASIDYARDANTGFTNLGCRRLMLRGPRAAGIDLNAPSDLRALYQAAVAKGERLPVAFTVGSHPADFLAAVASTPAIDELELVGAVRGAPLPVVRCATVDVKVPADAELVLEGYLDERGLVEPEGPYGEYVGYYGVLKTNPVFHLTAITKRRDALFQTVTIGTRLNFTDTAQLAAAKTEAVIWSALQQAIREPVAVCCTASSGGMYNVRVSLRQRYPGEARNAIAAVFGSSGDVKHVFVVDDDIDVYSDEQIDWALATRFQADRDFVVATGFRCVPLDPSLQGSRTGAKGGFDCTKPFGQRDAFEFTTPTAPQLPQRPRRSGIEAALAEGPASYLELMAALGTRDGRELLHGLDALYRQGRLQRLQDGRYTLDQVQS
jgi:2,5-furandicarboxylate decarboxylase 1